MNNTKVSSRKRQIKALIFTVPELFLTPILPLNIFAYQHRPRGINSLARGCSPPPLVPLS